MLSGDVNAALDRIENSGQVKERLRQRLYKACALKPLRQHISNVSAHYAVQIAQVIGETDALMARFVDGYSFRCQRR